jgi:hypothetical protein
MVQRYSWVIIMGALWETVAFIVHALGTHDQQNIGYATAYQILFLLAPLWINAFVYMSFARMVHYFAPDGRVWRVKAASLAKYFVWADVGSFIIQGVGAMMTTPGADAQVLKTGINVYMAGIGVQEAFIVFFLVLMIVFHRQRLSQERQPTEGHVSRDRSWRPLLFAMYGVLVAITVCVACSIQLRRSIANVKNRSASSTESASMARVLPPRIPYPSTNRMLMLSTPFP